VVWSNWNTDGTLPLCPVTALHLPGPCHCVSCGSRRWRGPRESCSRGRSMAPHSPRPCTVCPSFPGMLVGSRFSLLFLYWDPLFLFLWGPVARTPPCRLNPIPSFLLFPPLKLAQGAHHGRCSPHLVALPSDSPLRRLHFRCAAPPAIRCHLACFSSIQPSDLA
jgi:hypothetical protein